MIVKAYSVCENGKDGKRPDVWPPFLAEQTVLLPIIAEDYVK